ELIAEPSMSHPSAVKVSFPTILDFDVFLRCSLLRVETNELPAINSAATSVSMPQASAANIAEAELIRNAILPKGRSETRCARIRYNGKPGVRDAEKSSGDN